MLLYTLNFPLPGECPPGLELTPDLKECKDIDECSRTSGICSNGVCENMMGTYQCVCNEGYKQIGNNRAHCEGKNQALVTQLHLFVI